jgi:hypothetical protein
MPRLFRRSKSCILTFSRAKCIITPGGRSMSRKKILSFIGIYIAIILAMLFVFFFIQERYRSPLFMSPKINATGKNSLMYEGNTPENFIFSAAGLSLSENPVPLDNQLPSLIKIHVRPKPETFPCSRSIQTSARLAVRFT